MSNDVLVSKFKQLEAEVNSELKERTVETHTAVLALVAQKHHFQIGEPGVAKSLLVERIAQRIDGIGDEGYFRWLLSNFTSPAELYGMPDPNLFKSKGVYKHNTERKLPRAKIVFLDEIFKGSSSILNANLTAMNERLFFNHDDDPNIPLISLFAASNEMPEPGNLTALLDRLHFRHRVSSISNHGNFIGLLADSFGDDIQPVISYEDLLLAHAESKKVKVSSEIFETLYMLKKSLEQENVPVTDRRWKECIDVIKAEAFLNGHDEAQQKDLRPLMHLLWSTEEQIMTVFREVLSQVSPIEKDASDIMINLLSVEDDLREAIHSADKERISATGTEVYKKLETAKPKIYEMRDKLRQQDIESQIIVDVIDKYKEIARTLKQAQNSLDNKTI